MNINLKKYQNEIILLVSILFMLSAYIYKTDKINSFEIGKKEVALSLSSVSKISSLKDLWGDKKLSAKVPKLKMMVNSSKVKSFSIKSKKLKARFINLTIKELSTLLQKISNIAVEITLIDVKKDNDLYNMELKCKW
jgi:hypothetical protein